MTTWAANNKEERSIQHSVVVFVCPGDLENSSVIEGQKQTFVCLSVFEFRQVGFFKHRKNTYFTD